jgi:hypothetical protein
MRKLKWNYVFLAISLTGFAIAFVDRQPTMLSYLSLPIGAIVFGLFFVATVLEKESALYDEQNQAMRMALGKSPRPSQILRPPTK